MPPIFCVTYTVHERNIGLAVKTIIATDEMIITIDRQVSCSITMKSIWWEWDLQYFVDQN